MVNNTLAPQFQVDAPETSWVTEITYIQTKEGLAYLAVVIDLFAPRLGWSLQTRQTTEDSSGGAWRWFRHFTAISKSRENVR